MLELQGEDGLAGPRPAVDDERGLRVPVGELGDLREDGVEHDELLIEQGVDRLALDHRGGVLEELAVRAVGALAHIAALAPAEPSVQEGDEVVDAVPGEQRVGVEQVRMARMQELGVRVVEEVVQVGARGERDRPVMERGVPVREVLQVLPGLRRGVQHLLRPSAVAHDHQLLDVGGLAVAPLLQLNDDRVRPALMVEAGDHRVQPA